MGIQPETALWWDALPACLPGGAAREQQDRSQKARPRVSLQIPPEQLESIYLPEPERGREENTEKSVWELGKLSRESRHRVKSKVLWTGNDSLG